MGLLLLEPDATLLRRCLLCSLLPASAGVCRSFSLQLFVPWGPAPTGTQWLVWPDGDLGTTLHLPAATRCCSPCLSLVSNHCTLKCLEWLYMGFFWDQTSPPLSLHPAPSCDSLCVSVYRPQKLVASFPYAAWSPAPLLIFSKQPKALNISCRFTLCLTFRSASLSSCVVNTVQGSCSGLLRILNMLFAN